MAYLWARRTALVRGIALGAAWWLGAWVSHATGTANADATRWAEGQIIVNFERDATAAERERILAELDAEVIRAYHNIPAALCRLRSGTTLATIEAEHLLPGLRKVEPNGALRLDGVPNDPLFGSQSYLNHTAGQPGLPGADIRAVHAWDVERGSREVVVGVIDLNIDLQHPDLVDNIYTNPAEIPGNGLDDDQNGWVDDVHGPQPLIASTSGHGTSCAGILAAATGNGVGVAGVADITIMPLRIGRVANYNEAWVAGVVEVADYAIDMGVDVISMSAGDTDALYVALHDIFAAAGERGIYLVMSAGNDQGEMTQPHYPACFEDIDRIISVGATDPFDNATFNWHPTWVDLAAPGYVDATCAAGGGYTSFGGTSASAPQVAGVVALILSKYGNTPGFDAKARLLATVDVLPALAGRNLTGGRLNAFLAVAEPDDVAPAPAAWLQAGSITSTRAVVSWPASGDDRDVGRASSYELRLSTAPIDETTFDQATVAPGLPDPDEPGAVQSVPVTGLVAGTTYHLALRVYDEWGSYRRRCGGDFRANASTLATGSFTTIAAPVLAVAPTTIKLDAARGAHLTRTFTVRNTGQDVLDFTTRVTAGTDHASCAPTGGRLSAGEAAEIAVSLAVGEAPCGRLAWTIEVAGNDPATPTRTVSVQPDIRSGPTATLSTTTLDFGVVPAGQSRVLTPELINDGCEPLLVHSVAWRGSGEFAYGGPTPIGGSWFVVPPGSAISIPIEYRPTDFGDDEALITLTTSAIDAPVVAIAATGSGSTAPQAEFGATAVSSPTMYTGAVDTVGLALHNAGGSPLDYAVAGDLPSWLQVVPSSGTLDGGMTRQLAFVFSAAGRCADDSATVVITTNDANASPNLIATRLRALPGCHIQTSALAPLTYDNPYREVLIWNAGCPGEILTVTGAAASATGPVGTSAPFPLVIHPGGYAWLGVWSEDCYEGDGVVRIFSNDPDQPEIRVPFTFDCGPEPARPSPPTLAAGAPGLVSVYPNPFNAGTTLRVTLDRESAVAACVFDVAGRRVWRHELGVRGPGLVEVEWRGQGDGGAGLPSGTYFCRFDLGDGRWSSLEKMTLLK